jgi:hypothetical protein
MRRDQEDSVRYQRAICSGATLLGVLILELASASAQQPPPAARATIADVAWLAGAWVLERPAISVEERWTRPAGGAMLGLSRTVKGDRMVAFEYLRVIERDGGLVYVAQPNGRPPTEFVLTDLSGESATFENPAHDFPKVIRYTLRADGTLEARISDGGERGQSLVFTRQPITPGKAP